MSFCAQSFLGLHAHGVLVIMPTIVYVPNMSTLKYTIVNVVYYVIVVYHYLWTGLLWQGKGLIRRDAS